MSVPIRKRPIVAPEPTREPNDWVFPISDGVHFNNSIRYSRWGIKSIRRDGGKVNEKFLKNAVEGDRLWFCKSKTHSQVYAMATFTHTSKREITSDELGWTENGDDYDTEIHYKDLYIVSKCDIHLKTRLPMCAVFKGEEKHGLDWADEHSKIVRYSKAKKRPAVAPHNPLVESS
jgi:hypothetical protein